MEPGGGGLGVSVGEAKSQLGGPQSQISGLEDEESKKEKTEHFPICAYGDTIGHLPFRGQCPKLFFNSLINFPINFDFLINCLLQTLSLSSSVLLSIFFLLLSFSCSLFCLV